MQKRLCQSEKPIKQQQPRLCSRGCCCHIVFLFHAGDFRERGDALRKLGVGGDVVGHLAVVERLIGGHVKVAGAGIEQRRGLILHVRAEIVLGLRHIGFVEIDLVGDVPVFHSVLLLFCQFSFWSRDRKKKKLLSLQMQGQELG